MILSKSRSRMREKLAYTCAICSSSISFFFIFFFIFLCYLVKFFNAFNNNMHPVVVL